MDGIESNEVKFINKLTKIHIAGFIIYTTILIIYISVYQFSLVNEMATCENNPSKFCPSIYDSNGLVNKPNPNSAVQASSITNS